MAFGLNIGDLLLTLLADGSMLQRDIERQGIAAADAAGATIGRSLGASIAAGLTSRGKAMSTIGRSLTQNLTLPIVAAGTAITFVGMKFDTALRRIVALTDVTADEIAGIKSGILDLAQVVGRSPQELAEAFYFLASGGFNASESMDILTVSAKAAASGLGETQDVAKVIGASINAFGKENLNAVDATDQLIRAIKDGTAEAPDFAGALGDVVGSAGLLGGTFSDTAGAMAAMTLVGINADEAATSLNQVFRALIKTTPQAARGFATVGLTVEGLKDQLQKEGLLSVLKTLETSFKDNDVAAGQAFGNVRALRGVLALLGEHLPATTRILNDVAGGTTDLASAFDETEGPGRRFDRAMVKFQIVLIDLSEDVLPVVLEVLEQVAGVVEQLTDTFKNLPSPIRGAAVRVLALTAALGPLLFISGKVVSGIGGIVGAIDALAKTRVAKGLAGVLIQPFLNLAGKITKPIASAIETGLLHVMTNPGVEAASTKLGSFMGSKLGKGLSIAFAAVAWYEVIETYNRIRAQLAAQNDQIDKDLALQLAKGSTAEVLTSRRVLEEQLAELNKVWDAGIFTTETRKRLEANLAAVTAELERRASGFGPAAAAGIAEGSDALYGPWAEITQKISSSANMSAAARAAGKSIPQSIAKGIIEEQNAPVSALNGLKQLMKDALTPSARIGRDIGILTSKALARGLRDKRDVVRAEARRVRGVAEKDLAELILGGGKVGKKAGEALKEGLKSKNPAVRRAAQRVKAIVDSTLQGAVDPAGQAGEDAGKAFADRLKAQLTAVTSDIANRIRAIFGGGSSEPKDNGHGRAIGGPVRAGRPYLVNENTPRSEVFVPSSSGGHVLTHAAAVQAVSESVSGGSRGGDVYVNLQGVLPVVRSADEITTELARLGDVGRIPDRRFSPRYSRREMARTGRS